ncbi:MAG TPA: T9SS type A sorting domain-containing protein, partial [Rubricoccaceae bacterium]
GVGWAGFIESADRTLFGGSLGHGLWRASGAVATESPAGFALALDLPAPNPSRGSVRVRFALPSASATTVAVYDALGRRVAVLADGLLGAGDHEAQWEADAAAGTYVVQLATPGGTLARAVTIVR